MAAKCVADDFLLKPMVVLSRQLVFYHDAGLNRQAMIEEEHLQRELEKCNREAFQRASQRLVEFAEELQSFEDRCGQLVDQNRKLSAEVEELVQENNKLQKELRATESKFQNQLGERLGVQRDLEGQLVDCQALHCKALECQRADQRLEREKWP